PGLAQTSARTPEADRLVVALPALRIAEHPPRRVEDVLRPRDRLEHIRRGARDQFRPQQGRLILVLPLDLARLGVRHRAEDVVPGDAGLHGASQIHCPPRARDRRASATGTLRLRPGLVARACAGAWSPLADAQGGE